VSKPQNVLLESFRLLTGTVWTFLYAMMAAAAWLVWCKSGDGSLLRALTVFEAQLVLNVVWSTLFSFIHATENSVLINEETLRKWDQASVNEVDRIVIEAKEPSGLILSDVPLCKWDTTDPR
jgi:hypothetical protein